MKPVYRVIWLIARVSLRFFYPVRWRHRERVPQGRVILSGNHISYMDPIVIALSLPFPVHFMAKSELFEGSKFVAWLLPRVNAFPVRLGDSKRIHFPRITLVYGEPVVPSEYEGGRRERMQAMTSDIMERIESARKEAERG
jgi:1-acyl-sn-glycerol-3-phosphate acyltransferase